MLYSTIFATALAGTAFAADHIIAVGTKAGDIKFNPENVTAAVGDTVTFHYWPKNHSVVQSSFAKPCEPLANGFWSGFVPTSDATAVANTTFTYTVTNASAPVWFYCSQGKHCQAGMVGAINPPTTGAKTFAAYKNASSLASSNVSPTTTSGTGGKLSVNGTSTSGGSSASSSAATGAASQLSGSVAFAGLTGLFTFFML